MGEREVAIFGRPHLEKAPRLASAVDALHVSPPHREMLFSEYGVRGQKHVAAGEETPSPQRRPAPSVKPLLRRGGANVMQRQRRYYRVTGGDRGPQKVAGSQLQPAVVACQSPVGGGQNIRVRIDADDLGTGQGRKTPFCQRARADAEVHDDRLWFPDGRDQPGDRIQRLFVERNEGADTAIVLGQPDTEMSCDRQTGTPPYGAGSASGLPFSTRYTDTTLVVFEPGFLAVWAPSFLKTSPALNVVAGLPGYSMTTDPSRT